MSCSYCSCIPEVLGTLMVGGYDKPFAAIKVCFSVLWSLLFNLRTFARKYSNIDNSIKLLPLIANELLVSEMQK